MAAFGPGLNIVIALNDIVRVTLLHIFAPQIGVNVRHYRCSAVAGGGATLGQFATLLDTAFAADTKALLSVSANYGGVQVQRIAPTPPSAPAWEKAGIGSGTVAGDALPTQTSGLIKLLTLVAGRMFRGRVYVPFPGEADSDITGKPTAGYMTRLGILASHHLSQITVGAGATSTMLPVIWHRKTNTSNDVVTSAQVSGWATQRRRGSLGRPNPAPF